MSRQSTVQRARELAKGPRSFCPTVSQVGLRGANQVDKERQYELRGKSMGQLALQRFTPGRWKHRLAEHST